MATYLELKAQIAELQAQAEAARKQEIIDATMQIKFLMDQYNISIADLTQSLKAAPEKKTSVSPKYRDPATGKTWAGRGKAPKWLANEADREKYLIK